MFLSQGYFICKLLPFETFSKRLYNITTVLHLNWLLTGKKDVTQLRRHQRRDDADVEASGHIYNLHAPWSRCDKNKLKRPGEEELNTKTVRKLSFMRT